MLMIIAALMFSPPAAKAPEPITMFDCHDMGGRPLLLKFKDGIIRPVCATPDRKLYLLKLEIE